MKSTNTRLGLRRRWVSIALIALLFALFHQGRQQLLLARIYLDITGRQPKLLERLTAVPSFDREQLARSLVTSLDARRWQVQIMYWTYLDRGIYNLHESAFWVGRARGNGEEHVRIGMTESMEYQQRWSGGDPARLVETWFQRELFRKPGQWSEEEKQKLLAMLTPNGMSGELARLIIASKERRCRWLTQTYFYFTGAEIAESTLKSWVTTMESGVQEHELIPRIIGGSAYPSLPRLLAAHPFVRPPPARVVAGELRQAAEQSKMGAQCLGTASFKERAARLAIVGTVSFRDHFPQLALWGYLHGLPTDPSLPADFVLPQGVLLGSTRPYDAVDRSGRAWKADRPFERPGQFAPPTEIVPSAVSGCGPTQVCFQLFEGALRGDAQHGYLLRQHSNGDLWQLSNKAGEPQAARRIGEGILPNSFEEVHSIDFFGEGAMDLVARSAGELRLFVIKESGETELQHLFSLPEALGAPFRTFVLRLDGDPREDLLILYADGTALRTLSGQSSSDQFSLQELGEFTRSESIVSADVDGDGKDELVANGPEGRFLDVLFLGAPGESARLERWAELREGVQIRMLSSGNFSGAGKEGVAGFFPGSELTLLAMPEGRRFVVYELGDPWVPGGMRRMVVGDHDLDGDSDLVAWLPDGRLKIGLSTGKNGLPWVKVYGGENLVARSGPSGFFELRDVPAGKYRLTPSLLGYQFTPETIEVEVIDQPVQAHFWYTDDSPVADLTKPSGVHKPLPCVGYHRMFKSWSYAFNCSIDEAYYALEEHFGEVSGPCCPLPSDDILSDEHIYTSEACPDDFVLTGGWDNRKGPYARAPFKCTRINTERYQLGPIRPASYYGLGVSGFGYSEVLSVNKVPAAIRYALGRVSHKNWNSDGCIGIPLGSLYVHKASGRCFEQFTRQLQYRGIPGDPPAGTPVKMLPDCVDITDIFSPRGECVPSEPSGIESAL